MNRIILAYAPENSDLAESIDRQLSRIGIPFEHANEAISVQIAAAGEPVLLLVTDNFLVNRACMAGLLPVLQSLAAENRLVAVIADGKNAAGQAVPTHIDRMANALHYMKHWQDVWLALSDRHQHADGAEKASLVADLDATISIANSVGDIISTLRDLGYLTWAAFEADDFEAFFQKFNLQDWHGQYKRLSAQAAEKQLLEASAHLPEMPIIGGLLTPEPVQEPIPPVFIPEPTVETPPIGAVVEETEIEVIEPPEVIQAQLLDKERQAARDAWFWIEKGHESRGLDLFQMALEQYPES